MKSSNPTTNTYRDWTALGWIRFACENEQAKRSHSKRYLSGISRPIEVNVHSGRFIALRAMVGRTGTCMPAFLL